MSNVVNLDFGEKFELEYIRNSDDAVVGISHPKWPFDIYRKDNEIAFVSEDDEAFGILPRDQFNAVLLCWLLVDDSKLVDDAVNAKDIVEQVEESHGSGRALLVSDILNADKGTIERVLKELEK